MTKKCIHCLRHFKRTTKDHVFPSSWYPDSTEGTVQRWTAPSCAKCNNNLGKLEKELLIRFGMCIDPAKWAALGLSTKALGTLGVRVANLPKEEAAHRRARKKRIISELQAYRPDMRDSILPGFGLHAAFPAQAQTAVLVSAKALVAVAEKIIRGCEFKLSNRYVEKHTSRRLLPPRGRD